MSDGISQADLDALFAGLGDAPTEPKKEPTQEENSGLNQADLDALFAGLGDMGAPAPEPEKKESIGAKMEAAWQAAPPPEENKGESLSQDEIDKMLSEFGLG